MNQDISPSDAPLDTNALSDTSCQAAESCTDPACSYHRFDLYSAMVGVADAWTLTLGMHEPDTARRAFLAVAELAASEVLP